ncbi:hypothetical protein Tco_0145853 [Tanacetum coccineum]
MPPPYHHLVTTLLAFFTSLLPPHQLAPQAKPFVTSLDAFSSTNTPDYTPASPDYSPASPGNTSSDPSENLSKDLLASLAISPFHGDPYMKVMQAYNATNDESPIPLPQAPIAPPTVLPPKNELVPDHPPLLLPYLKYLRLEKVLIRRVWSAMRNRSRLF